ncbi:sensor histidine kinase [Sulfurihydrogenibium azorense]|uniref:sensor histidine kinase n=1 Tax=Sulfurihydrogenibium azorense TaxID=309806 RepID=UPI0024093ECE|nr:ATP-binding protein [Sulfurihydrogenibium azorense]MDM7273609.1 ATP-binding protein [Sulfurihydrogenibium azorense]
MKSNINDGILITFLDFLKEGIIIVDDETKVIEFVNRFAKKFLKDENYEGKNFKEVIDNDYIYSLISYNQEKDVKAEVNIDNQKYLINVYRIEGKKIIHIQDITPFEVYKQAKKDFVSNVSHELKTPISVLKSAVETIEEEKDPVMIKKFVNIAKKRIEQMDHLINDLLILARLESQEDQVKKESYDLHKQIEEIFEDLKHLTEEKEIQLINQVPNKFDVYADEQKLSIALKNLIENAIKYNKQNGKVIVKAVKDSKYTTITVEDTGIGIPEESIPLIFERFYRVDKSRSRNIGGTGLGLSIVKHITEAHKGKVWVESKLGEGSKFFIKIPNT